ncbi:MAG: VCBS repeat-containing protein [Gammaproteobacteria bacterium]|nr:VCBS repeat-containing protein [Gammaproteobacteria bacterium]
MPIWRRSELERRGSLRAIAAADFNADGHIDLAVPRASDNDVVILRNDGEGGFTVQSAMNVGTRPVSITPFDFNNDGRFDLVVANAGSNDISILDNHPMFGFLNDSEIPFRASPQAIDFGDFNGDGAQDLVAAAGGDNSHVAVLFNQGNGSFTKGNAQPVGLDPVDIVVADLNGDGSLDIATANQGSGNVSVVNNDGSFDEIGGASVDCVSANPEKVVSDSAVTPLMDEGPVCTKIEPGLFELRFSLVPDANSADSEALAIVRAIDHFTQNMIDEADVFGRIIPVNDPPAFSPGGDVAAVADMGIQVIESWSTDIQSGRRQRESPGPDI